MVGYVEIFGIIELFVLGRLGFHHNLNEDFQSSAEDTSFLLDPQNLIQIRIQNFQ